MANLTINLPKKLEKQLEHLEKTTGKSKEFFCQETLIQYFRVIYQVKEEELIVLILRAGHRKEVY